MRQNGYEEKLNKAFEQVKGNYSEGAIDLRSRVESDLKSKPTDIWWDVVEGVSDEVISRDFKKSDF